MDCGIGSSIFIYLALIKFSNWDIGLFEFLFDHPILQLKPPRKAFSLVVILHRVIFSYKLQSILV
jgi:hypothetical protein